VLAADIDRGSVRLARENVRGNGLNARRMRVRWSDGPRRLGPGRNGIVCANILARPLRRLSRDLARTVGPGGMLILSGLLAAQSADVVAAYRFQRLALVRCIALDGWYTLVLRRRPATGS
jgi:ribosomal protein L11 methyltransferase